MCLEGVCVCVLCVRECCDGLLFQSRLLKDYTSSIKQPFLLCQRLAYMCRPISGPLVWLFLSFSKTTLSWLLQVCSTLAKVESELQYYCSKIILFSF